MAKSPTSGSESQIWPESPLGGPYILAGGSDAVWVVWQLSAASQKGSAIGFVAVATPHNGRQAGVG
jgi:hypothetical protein